MGRALVAITLTTAVLALAGPTIASAGTAQVDYANCQITIDVTHTQAGHTVELSGTGLEPTFDAPVLFDGSQIATVTTDATGSFGPTPVTIPANASGGAHTLTVECDVNANLVDTEVDVDGIPPVNLTLSRDEVPVEVVFDATLTGAEPGSTVTFNRFSKQTFVGTDVADGTGTATIHVAFPVGTPLGAHTVQATGTDTGGNPFDVTAPITVVGSDSGGSGSGSDGGSDGGSGNLPHTGSSSTEPLVLIGVAAVVAGGALLIIAKRRRSRSA